MTQTQTDAPSSISVEDFLSQPRHPEDDHGPEDLEQPRLLVEVPTVAPDAAGEPPSLSNSAIVMPRQPLESIAHSLDRLLAIAEHHELEESEVDRLREAHDDLDAKYAALFDLLDEVETIVKPSTSKLANTVREAIDRWRDPQVPTEAATAQVPAVDPEPAAVVEAPAGDPTPVPATGAPAAPVHARGAADLIGACGNPGPTTNTAGYVTCSECLEAGA